MDIGPVELIIVLVIVILFFGPGRLAKVGGELGQALRSFREGIKDSGKSPDTSEAEMIPNENQREE